MEYKYVTYNGIFIKKIIDLQKIKKMKKNLLIFISLIYLSYNSQTIALQNFATGFSNPVDIENAGDTRLFIVEQGGLIKILNANGTVNATPFLNIASLISSGGERGLLGLAFHPNYVANGYFFVNYTNTSGNTVIARYTVSANPDIANTTETILLTITQPYSNHNGGSIKFGPDGYLYIGMGDGGSGGDPGNRAQNINENLGKMLRINVNSSVPPYYTIPAGNPYVGIVGNDEIWALGLRNPWKFSFNRINGDLWIADVGQNAVEEIDKVTNPPTSGLNFGWRCYEGNSTYNTSGCLSASNYTFPFAQYARSGGACSVTGGYVYTGSIYPNFQNKYFFTDYCDDKIRMVNTSTATITTTTAFSGNNFVTFGEDSSGELYIAGITSGTVYKITDSSLQTDEVIKENLSIYPTKVRDFITLKSNSGQKIIQIDIYNTEGRLILTQSITELELNLSVSGLEKGIYFLNVTTENGIMQSSKFIKQ